MARIDKYDPKSGGFRAPLDADTSKTAGGVGDADEPLAVGLSATGTVVAGDGNTGIVGLLVLASDKKAGDIVDVMTDGEVVEFGGAAGTTYYGDGTDGSLTDTGPGTGVNAVKIGHTVEADRLVVRVTEVQGA